MDQEIPYNCRQRLNQNRVKTVSSIDLTARKFSFLGSVGVDLIKIKTFKIIRGLRLNHTDIQGAIS